MAPHTLTGAGRGVRGWAHSLACRCLALAGGAPGPEPPANLCRLQAPCEAAPRGCSARAPGEQGTASASLSPPWPGAHAPRRVPGAAPARQARAGSGEHRPVRGRTCRPARTPQAPRLQLTQIASSSTHAGPVCAIPATAARPRLGSSLAQRARPPAPPRPTATATSQSLPASQFPVPRLPKHAHQAGGAGAVLSGSCSSRPERSAPAWGHLAQGQAATGVSVKGRASEQAKASVGSGTSRSQK